MSATPISQKISFMDEEKRSICKKISKIMEKDNNAYCRIRDTLEDCKKSFLEELPINALKFLLKLEEAWLDDTIGEVLLSEGLKRGII